MSNTTFTVKDLAELIETQPDVLIEALEALRDDINWTFDTVVQGDIAANFIDEYETRRDKRQTKLTTTPANGTQLTPQYFVDQQQDVQLALRRTIADLSINEIIVEGVQDAFEEIQAYEEGRTQTWLSYAEKLAARNEQQAKQNRVRRQEVADNIATDNFQLLAKLQELRDNAENKVNAAKNYLQQVTGETGK